MPAIVATNLANAKYGKYEFGIDTVNIIKALRDLADDVESGIAIPMAATVYRKSKSDDYPETILVLKLVESVDEKNRIPDPKTKALYSPNSQFPVDTALTFRDPDDRYPGDAKIPPIESAI